VARKVVEILKGGCFQANAYELGQYLEQQLKAIPTDKVKEFRCRGLWVGVEFKPEAGVARKYCEALMHEGILCKDTHAQTMRLAPPLCITKDELDWALERIRKVLV
jgi:ornithine--oxo-acid transaminase